jgi:hypothetical protein
MSIISHLNFKVRDIKNGQLVIHNLLTHEAFLYDPSGNGRVLLTKRLGVTLDNNNYHHIEIVRRPAGSNDLSNNYLINFYSKSSAVYNLTYEVSNAVNQSTNGEIACRTHAWKIDKKDASDKLYRQEFEDCVSLNDESARWYGQSESKFQQFWPINPYTTNDSYIPYVNGLFEDGASVMERYWLSTNGLAIIVHPSVPLFLKKNSTDLCFKSNAHATPYSQIPATPVILTYDICQVDMNANRSSYLNRLHSHVINSYFAKPTGLPDLQMFKYPIWSTWAKYKKNITDEVIFAFATEIRDFAQTRVAHLEIDDFWETAYGNLEFDLAKFPA